MRRLTWEKAQERRELQRWYRKYLAEGGSEVATPSFILEWRKTYRDQMPLFNAPLCVYRKAAAIKLRGEL